MQFRSQESDKQYAERQGFPSALFAQDRAKSGAFFLVTCKEKTIYSQSVDVVLIPQTVNVLWISGTNTISSFNELAIMFKKDLL